jgi:hypothetical protein
VHNMRAYGGMEVNYHSLLIAKQEEEEWTARHGRGGGCNAGSPTIGSLKDPDPALFCMCCTRCCRYCKGQVDDQTDGVCSARGRAWKCIKNYLSQSME